MKDKIIRQFEKAGARVSGDKRRIEVPLPTDGGETVGKLIAVFVEKNVLFGLIDIHSLVIPDLVANPVESARELKINYCMRGRCELQLKTGGCTYLTAGEIAVDAGQAESSFYFPGAEYLGYEVIVHMEDTARESGPGLCGAAEDLYQKVLQLERPWIQKAGKFLSTFYEAFRYYTREDLGAELLGIKCLELMTYLGKLNLHQMQPSRTYYTASQVDIAKRVRALICEDLSLRHTAKALAAQFGVSETSVKNYFRSVYGCGFSEFQQYARMEKAASLLRDTEDRLSQIALAVGFASQPKFGAAFKACYGVTPLEYRRLKRLETRDMETSGESADGPAEKPDAAGFGKGVRYL